MEEIKNRACQVSPSDLQGMMEIADAVRRASDARPDQMTAAGAVRRSIHAVNQKSTDMKVEVLRLRWGKLLLTL